MPWQPLGKPFVRLATSTSSTRVLFPDPETPVITVRRCKGMGTSMFCRLRRLAPCTIRNLSGAEQRASSGSRRLRRLKYSPVAVAAFQSSSGVPWKTTSPPCQPAPGPRSTAWSALTAARRSCSTKTTGPGRSPKAGSRRCTSAGCSPMVGSSRICSISSKRLMRVRARRTRWASPRERVGEGRSRLI